MKMKPNNIKILKLSLLVLGVVLFAGIFAVLEKTGKTNVLHLRSASLNNTEKTTSTAPTAQQDFTDGNTRDQNTTSSSEGSVTDNNGAISTIPPQSEWSSSANNNLIVYSPARNTALTSGQVITGKSTSDRVSFRLIDNVSGVIAEGQIAVIDSSFSGTFSFSTNASQGRLDIFNTSADGTESNNVEIPVRFN